MNCHVRGHKGEAQPYPRTYAHLNRIFISIELFQHCYSDTIFFNSLIILCGQGPKPEVRAVFFYQVKRC